MMSLQTSMSLLILFMITGQMQVSFACKSGSKPVKGVSTEEVIHYTTPPEDILYLGSEFFGLPSFKPLPNCSAPSHPLHDSLKHAVTGVVDGKILTCGGVDLNGSWDTQSSCNMMERGSWIPQPGMKHKRSGAAASITKDGGMFVTGGTNKEHVVQSSTEFFKDGEWTEYPNLPVRMSYHCQVTTDSGVIVAGIDIDNRLSFIVYRLENGEWNELIKDSRFHYRVGHSCQLLTNDRLVILGGMNYQHQVDVLDLKSLTWSAGPRIPIELTHNFSVFYQGILYVIRWQIGDVYSIPENLTGEWVAVKHYDNTLPIRQVLLNTLPKRQVFPAPIVKYSDYC